MDVQIMKDIGDVKRIVAIMEHELKKNKELLEKILKLVGEGK